MNLNFELSLNIGKDTRGRYFAKISYINEKQEIIREQLLGPYNTKEEAEAQGDNELAYLKTAFIEQGAKVESEGFQ